MTATARPDQGAPRPIYLSWSSGKDSAWALATLLADPRFDVRGLLTTCNESFDRVAMHGVRGELLQAQADTLGLPLVRVDLPQPCSDADYQARMRPAIEQARDNGIEGFAFGDLFLADVREYRERQLDGTGLSAHFPLWGRNTSVLAYEMIREGVKAVLTCIDTKVCPSWMAGAEFDAELLRNLPKGVDPCGEQGEFHTFVYDGPAFPEPLTVTRGEAVQRGDFMFTDLLPSTPS